MKGWPGALSGEQSAVYGVIKLVAADKVLTAVEKDTQMHFILLLLNR